MPAVGTQSGLPEQVEHDQRKHRKKLAHKAKRQRVRRRKNRKEATKEAAHINKVIDDVVDRGYHAADRVAQRTGTAPEQKATAPGHNFTAYVPSDDPIRDQLAENPVNAIYAAPAKHLGTIEDRAKISETGVDVASIFVPGGGELKAARGLGGTIAKRLGISGAESAAKKEAEKVLASGATKVAKKAAASRAARSGEKAAVKRATKSADKALAKQAKAQRKVAKAIEKKATTAPQRVRTKAGKVWKAKQPAALTKSGRKVARIERAANINKAAVIAAPTVGAVGAGVADSTIKALKDDPKKTLATTARSIPGLVTAPVKLAAETVETGKNIVEGKSDPFAPLKAEGNAQLEYYKGLAEIAKGGEKAAKLVENEYGLTPAITAALGVQGLRRHTQPHPALRDTPEPKITKGDLGTPTRVKTLRKRAADASNPERARRAKKQLMEAERGKGKRKREVARTNDTSERLAQAGFAEDIKTPTAKRRNLGKEYRELSAVKLNDRVSLADAIHVLGQHGIPLEAKRGLQALQEVKQTLRDTKQTPSIEARTNREVIDALIEHPEYLDHSALPRFLEGYRAARHDISIKRHEDRVGPERAAGKPDPLDDRARLLPLAREKGVHSPEERAPAELSDIGYEPKKYVNANKAIKAKAKSMIKQAGQLERRAKAVRKYDAAKAAELEGKAATMRVEAERRLAVVSRPAQASKLISEAEAAKLAGDTDTAKALRAQARKLREDHTNAEIRKLNEFRSEVGDHIGERNDPIFFHDYNAADAGSPTAGGRHVKTAGLSPKEKMNLGQLREMGLVDTSGQMVIEGLFRDRLNLEVGRGFRSLLERVSNDKAILTGKEARRQLETGEAPAGHSLFPVQEFKRAYQRGDAEHAMGLIESAMRDKLSRAEMSKAKGKKYAWIPTSTLKEQYAEMEPLSRAGQNLRRFGGLQSRLLLGTSPTWAAMQLFATPILLLARHPNPLTWAKAAKLSQTAWKQLPDRQKAAVRAEFGGNIGDVAQLRKSELGPTADNIRSMHDAVKGINRSWAGNALLSIAKLEPLIKGVAAYEGKLRTLETLMEYDKLHNPGPVKKFLGSLSVLHKSTTENIAKLAGMSDKERLAYIASHPHEQEVLRSNIDSTLGDWSSMTALEKKASSVVIFYPFLRFSLKWMLQTFPRDNPAKAAILANLAQQNAQEVEEMIGGTPSFFQTFGLVPFRDQEGNVSGALNLSRIAPGSNALVEGLGSGSEVNLATATRLLQPVFGASVTTLAGQDAFGQPSETPKGLLFAQQILGLNTITRATVLPKVKEQSPVSKLFGEIEGKSPLEKALVPDFTVSKGEQRAAQTISENLDKGGKAPSTDEIAAMAKTMVAELDGKLPNEHNIKALPSYPAIQKMIQRARTADTASATTQDWLRAQGLGDSPEESAAFGALYGMLNPTFTGFGYRSEADKKRYRRKKGLPPKEDSSSSGALSYGSSSSSGALSYGDSGSKGALDW